MKVLRNVTDLGRTKVLLFLIGMRASRFGRGSIGSKKRVLRNRAKPSRLGESAFQISFKAAHMALAYLFKYHRENMVIVLSSGRLVRNTPRAGLGRRGRRVPVGCVKMKIVDGHRTHRRQTYSTDARRAAPLRDLIRDDGSRALARIVRVRVSSGDCRRDPSASCARALQLCESRNANPRSRSRRVNFPR